MYKFFSFLIVMFVFLFSGCSFDMYQHTTNAQQIKQLVKTKSPLLSAVQQTQTRTTKDTFIFMRKSESLSSVLNRLGELNRRYYVLRGKDFIINGANNFKIHNFEELKQYVKILTPYTIKITKNLFVKNAPKIVQVYETVPATALDRVHFSSSNLQVPAHIFSSLSEYAAGWRIVDKANAKALFNSQQYVNFNGTLREFIEYFAKNNDLFVDFNYRKKEITYSKYKTRHFPLKMVTEKYSFKNKIESGIDDSSGGSSKSSSSTIDVSSSFDSLLSLKNLLNKIIDKSDPRQYWSILPSVNELVVKTTPNKLKTIESVVENINAVSLQQIDIKIIVYEVLLNKQYQNGINWGYVNEKLNSLGDTVRMTAASTNSIVPALDKTLTAPAIFKYSGEGLNALVSLLNNFGRTQLSYQIPLRTTNNIPAICSLANKVGYVSKFSTSDTTNSTQTSIEQDQLTTGQYVYVKPTLFNNRILMSVKMVFSDLNSLTKQLFDNGQYIQTPDFSKNSYNQNIVLHNNDKIVIGGIIKHYNQKKYNGLSDENNVFSSLLGVKDRNNENKEMVIVIEAKKE